MPRATSSPDGHPVTIELVFLRDARQAVHPHDQVRYRIEQHPLRVTDTPDAAVTALAGPGVEVVHSTSWRYDHDLGVVLTYAVLPDPRPDLRATPLHDPAVVCSGDALRPAPDTLHDHHVVAHAVRHLAYLLDHDPGIAATAPLARLTGLWTAVRTAADGMPTGTHDEAHADARARTAAIGPADSRANRPSVH